MALQLSQGYQEISGNCPDEFIPGEHVVAFWLEDKFQWYLGVVDEVVEGIPVVSYMIRSGENWVFPETAEVIETPLEQIIEKGVVVEYLKSVRIRCKLKSEELALYCHEKINLLNTQNVK